MTGMRNDILIISDDLIEPPSEILPIRTITMISRQSLEMDILLHTTQEMKDLLYKWMKPRGLMDYISHILNELEFEDGIRMDITGIYPNTIVVRTINVDNQHYLLDQIKTLAGK